MADETNLTPPLPPAGELVTNNQALQVQWMMWRNTLAFGGTRDPSTIWAEMIRGDSNEFQYYRELEEKDDDVANGLREVRLGVMARVITLQPGDASQLAEDVRVFIQAQLDGLPNFNSALEAMLDAPGYGFSIAEQIFDVSSGQVSLVDLRDCPQELFLFGNRYEPQIGPLQFLSSPYMSDGALVPESKFAIYTHDMRSRNRKGRPLIRSVFWMSWFKRNLLRFWLRYAEKGPGTAVVKFKDGADQNDRNQAASIAQMLVESMACAVPESFQYEKELLQVARSQNPDVYDKLFQRLQYGIARRTQGQTLTSFGNEGGTGARAQGEVHQDTLGQITRGIAQALNSVVNRSIIRPLVLWNYGPNAPMPKWGFDTEEEDDLTKRLAIDSGLQRMGLPISRNYALSTYKRPAIEDGDEALIPNVSAPQVQETIAATSGSGGASFSEEAIRRRIGEREYARALRFRDGTDTEEDRAHVASLNRSADRGKSLGGFAEAMSLAFSERENHTPPVIKKETGEFDRIFGELAEQSRDVMKRRVKEVAEAQQP